MAHHRDREADRRPDDRRSLLQEPLGREEVAEDGHCRHRVVLDVAEEELHEAARERQPREHARHAP